MVAEYIFRFNYQKWPRRCPLKDLKSAHEFLDGNCRADPNCQYDPDHKANVASAPARHLEMEIKMRMIWICFQCLNKASENICNVVWIIWRRKKLRLHSIPAQCHSSPYQGARIDTDQSGMDKIKTSWRLDIFRRIFVVFVFKTRYFLTGLDALLISARGVDKLKSGVNHSVLGIHSKV